MLEQQCGSTRRHRGPRARGALGEEVQFCSKEAFFLSDIEDVPNKPHAMFH